MADWPCHAVRCAVPPCTSCGWPLVCLCCTLCCNHTGELALEQKSCVCCFLGQGLSLSRECDVSAHRLHILAECPAIEDDVSPAPAAGCLCKCTGCRGLARPANAGCRATRGAAPVTLTTVDAAQHLGASSLHLPQPQGTLDSPGPQRCLFVLFLHCPRQPPTCPLSQFTGVDSRAHGGDGPES